jgi:membrane-associated protease RseP (regulator of RpoE activity)
MTTARHILSLCLLLTFSLPSWAQNSAPRVEVFAGYAYAKNFQDGLITVFGPTGIIRVNDLSFHGWSGSVTANANEWFGVTADVGGYYRMVGLDLTKIGGNGGIEISANAYSYLFGPQFSSRKQESFTPFARVLLGGVRSRTGSVTDSEFAVGAGGGVDASIHRSIALRVAGDWIRTHFGEEAQNNVRLTTGLVFRFGGDAKRPRETGTSTGSDNKGHVPVAISPLGILGFETGQGFQVTSVSAKSPGENAGLRAQDVIVSIDGVPVHTSSEIATAISGKHEVRLTYLRRYWQTVTSVQLGR